MLNQLSHPLFATCELVLGSVVEKLQLFNSWLLGLESISLKNSLMHFQFLIEKHFSRETRSKQVLAYFSIQSSEFVNHLN
jgi:hypothetical protein